MVRYNPTGAPVEATPDLRSAVNALGSAMGRAVVYAGQTAALSAQRFRGGPGPTILVRWVPSSGDLPGSATADSVATGTAVAADGMLIEGEVHLAASAAPPPGPGPAGLELVLRHELAHAVGITAHSTDPNDVLYRTIQLAKAASWGPGDLRALAGVGCSSAP